MQLTSLLSNALNRQNNRGRYFHFWTVCLVACWCSTIYAKNSALIQPQLVQLSNQHGLSQNSINSFYQDPDGYIWISTLGGINRYDGSKILTIEDPDQLFTHKPFNSVSSDSWGNYWLNGRDGLVQVTESGKNIELVQFPAKPIYWTQANMLVGSERINQKQLMVFTWNGIYLYAPAEKDILQPQSMQLFHSKSLNLLSFLKADKGFWIGTSNGLYFYASDNMTLEQIDINNAPEQFKILNIQKLNETQLLLTSNHGIYKLDYRSNQGSQLNLINESVTTDVPIVAATRANQAYYAAGDRVFRYDALSHESTFLFALQDNLSDFSEFIISSLFIDANRLLWIGTQSQGAYIWDTKIPTFETWRVNSQDPSRRLDDDEVWSIKINKQKDYLVTTGKGLNLIDSSSGKVSHLLNMRNIALDNSKADVFDVLEIGTTLWLATQYGLIEHDLKHSKTTQHLPAGSDNTKPFVIYSLTSIDNRAIWLATDDGMMIFNTSLNEFNYNHNIMTRFNASETRHVSYQNELLWIGSQAKLLAYDFNTQNSKPIFEIKKDLSDQYYFITDILIEGNTAWLAFAGDGIYGLDFAGNTVVEVARYHTSTGLPDNQIFALEKVGNILWATTSQGLLRINTQTNQHTLFDHKYGLVGNEFNEGSSAILNSGDLLLGSTRGLTKITPDKLLKSSPLAAPKVAEGKVVSSDTSLHLWPVRTTINLNQEDSLLELEITNLDYMNSYSKFFEYWFESSDISSRKFSAISRLTLTDLPVGEHILNLRSRTLNLSETSATTKIKINVTQSGTITSIGQYLSILLTLGLLLFAIRSWLKKYQLNQQKAQNIRENEQRLELALLDESRGVWDCNIVEDKQLHSLFKVYQYQHQPLEMTLEQYAATIHPDDKLNFKRVWRKFIGGELEELDISYRCYFLKKWFWCRFQGSVNRYFKNGSPKRATGIWRSVDQEKEMENQLNLYSTAFESTQDIILILDSRYRIVLVNNAYEYTTGFPSQALLGKSMIDVAMSRATNQETKVIQKHLESNRRWHGQSSIARKNAASIPIEVKINLIEKDNEKIGYVVVMSEISQTKESETRSIRNNFYDRSTGLPSKTLAFDRLRQQIVRCRETARSLSLIFLGIDHLSELKSTLTQGTIDALFSQLTARLLPYIQKNDLLARYEPDIFLIVVQHSSQESNILHTVNQLLRELSKPIELNEQQLNISACAGISSYPDDGENWSELITKGETALAQTKQQGSNLFKYYHEDSNKKALERVALENKLSRALEEREMYLVFQPVVDFASNQIVEFDVSWRWRTDDGRTIYPSQFLPLVSELGMVKEFSNWLISNAFATLQRWSEEGLVISININLSVEYIATESALEFLRSKVADYKINPKLVFISIVEDDPDFSVTILEPCFNQIYAMGFNILMDDFGNQRASLKDLTSLKFHAVKLAKNITRNIGKSKTHDSVLDNLLNLMQSLNLGTVAKGIENKQQLDYLAAHGCQSGQGYFISDPLNESQARQSLLAR
jgi:diguanylate cyclase (GGDEF)-like protein/PAS domain S-box-containing protein